MTASDILASLIYFAAAAASLFWGFAQLGANHRK